MKPFIKLLGAIVFLVASGSVLALDRSPFSLITMAEPADWMLSCGLVTLFSIGRRRHILTRMNLWPTDPAVNGLSPNGLEASHQ